MRSRVIPGSSPTIERRLFVSRLNKVDLPTFGRPTMATSGSDSVPDLAGSPDLRYFAKKSPVHGSNLVDVPRLRYDHKRLTPYASKTASLLNKLQPSSS